MEETAVQQQQEVQTIDGTEVGAVEGVLGTEDTTQTMEAAIGDLFPSTPPPDKPIPQPQAHRARITGVSAETTNGGQRYLKFSFTSLENASDDNLSVFPPEEYVNNVMVDPATLSKEETITASGKKAPSAYAKYGQTVRNSGKTAKDGSHIPGDGTLETIARFATEQGHTVALQTPRTFDQLAGYLNALVTGTEVVALLRAQGGDGEFADRLRATRFVGFEYASQEKSLKGYRKLWQ